MYYTHMLDMGTTWLNHWGLDFDVWSVDYANQCERIASAQVRGDTFSFWGGKGEGAVCFPVSLSHLPSCTACSGAMMW